MKHIISMLIANLAILIGWGQSQGLPNIIIIIADDLGWGDVGYLGSYIKTPNIDRLAKEGIKLNRFYTAPMCSPTRAGLLIGRYPERYGLRNNVIRPWFDFGLDTTEITMPQVLAETGYPNRALIGKWHLGHSRIVYHPLRRGFNYFYGHLNGAIDYFEHTREGERDWHEGYLPSSDTGYSTDLITAKAIHCIKSFGKEGNPFYLQVAYNAPHTPLQARKRYLLQYADNQIQPLNHEGDGKNSSVRQTYAAMVTNMDQGIGAILQTLNELELESNTLVLFFSDNGADLNHGGSNGILKGGKLTVWEGGIRVPAIIKWPAGFKGGRTTDQLTGYIDVFPTILAISDRQYAPVNQFDGISILPVLNGSTERIERKLFLGNGAVMDNEWKLIKATGAKNASSDLSRTELEEDLLVRIHQDPSESHNLKNQHDSVYTNLKAILNEFETIRFDWVPPSDQRPVNFKPPKNWQIVRN